MDKEQASEVLNQLLKELHTQGGTKVTPAAFEVIAQAVQFFTEQKSK